MVQKTALGQGSPFIRGFTGFRTVLLIDGFRLNNSVFRDGPNQYWNTVDAWSLEKLELVKGPTSAQYGSDAVGGAVHARTVRPRFDGAASTWHATLACPIMSNGTRRRTASRLCPVASLKSCPSTCSVKPRA